MTPGSCATTLSTKVTSPSVFPPSLLLASSSAPAALSVRNILAPCLPLGPHFPPSQLFPQTKPSFRELGVHSQRSVKSSGILPYRKDLISPNPTSKSFLKNTASIFPENRAVPGQNSEASTHVAGTLSYQSPASAPSNTTKNRQVMQGVLRSPHHKPRRASEPSLALGKPLLGCLAHLMWQLFFKTMACPQPGGLGCDPTFCQAHTLLYLAYQLGILPDSAQTFQILPQGPEQMTHIWALCHHPAALSAFESRAPVRLLDGASWVSDAHACPSPRGVSPTP